METTIAQSGCSAVEEDGYSVKLFCEFENLRMIDCGERIRLGRKSVSEDRTLSNEDSHSDTDTESSKESLLSGPQSIRRNLRIKRAPELNCTRC